MYLRGGDLDLYYIKRFLNASLGLPYYSPSVASLAEHLKRIIFILATLLSGEV